MLVSQQKRWQGDHLGHKFRITLGIKHDPKPRWTTPSSPEFSPPYPKTWASRTFRFDSQSSLWTSVLQRKKKTLCVSNFWGVKSPIIYESKYFGEIIPIIFSKNVRKEGFETKGPLIKKTHLGVILGALQCSFRIPSSICKVKFRGFRSYLHHGASITVNSMCEIQPAEIKKQSGCRDYPSKVGFCYSRATSKRPANDRGEEAVLECPMTLRNWTLKFLKPDVRTIYSGFATCSPQTSQEQVPKKEHSSQTLVYFGRNGVMQPLGQKLHGQHCCMGNGHPSSFKNGIHFVTPTIWDERRGCEPIDTHMLAHIDLSMSFQSVRIKFPEFFTAFLVGQDGKTSMTFHAPSVQNQGAFHPQALNKSRQEDYLAVSGLSWSKWWCHWPHPQQLKPVVAFTMEELNLGDFKEQNHSVWENRHHTVSLAQKSSGF